MKMHPTLKFSLSYCYKRYVETLIETEQGQFIKRINAKDTNKKFN